LGRATERLEAKIPSGLIQQQWDKCRFEMKLVNPANLTFAFFCGLKIFCAILL
jgi:hypothetical protein